ncbi:MAG TPA: heparin lyase I family protein, partial [Opitutus sp.]|nr:heparin lyase I family protein [Opitutus sp.]
MPMIHNTSYEVGDYIPAEQFGDGCVHAVRYHAAGVTQDSLGPSPTPFNGSRTVRFACKTGDPPWTPSGSALGYRSEHEHDDHELSSSGTYCWYGWALYLNADWKIGSEGWRILTQWHLGSGQPALKLVYDVASAGGWCWQRRTTTNLNQMITPI